MKRGDFLFLGALAAGGIWVWVRDLGWLSATEETLSILAALPLFVWLGSPWRVRDGSWSWPRLPLLAVGLLAGAGIALDMTLLLAAAWTLALWTWLKERVAGEARLQRRLAILPLLAFPWVTLDLAPVGWWFRLSASWVVDHLYGALGFPVVRAGTSLLVHGLPIEVAAACSGMNSLQAILMAGVVLTWIEAGRSRWYWWSVACLPLLGWVANTARVCAVVAAALVWGPEAAGGPFHQILGWVVVLAVFSGWWLMVRWAAGLRQPRRVAA